MTDPTPLHRLFGLSWTDFLQGTGVSVEVEIDLSLKQQYLDLILIRRGAKPIRRPLPDGFEHLAPYNLITFKSHQESLDGWALCELIGHYVNYRKQVSPSMQDLLPETEFRLYAVCVRHPRSLIKAGALQLVRAGVYDAIIAGLATIRVIVVHELPREEHNAMLHLFSARAPLLRYATEHYAPRSSETSTLLYRLFRAYQEDPTMAPKLEEFVRQSIDELLKELPPQERMKGLTAEERLKGITAEKRLEGLSHEELRKAVEAAQRLLKADERAN